MDVHHAHHPTHKKNWKEYMLDFFKLFLIVFLGFIAENIREKTTLFIKKSLRLKHADENLIVIYLFA